MTDGLKLSCMAACGQSCLSSFITEASHGIEQGAQQGSIKSISTSSRSRVCVSLKLSPRAGQRA